MNELLSLRTCLTCQYFAALALSLFVIHSNAQMPIRPSNDEVASAIELPRLMLGQPQTYSSVGATRDLSEPSGNGLIPDDAAVWWRWRPTNVTLVSLHAGRGKIGGRGKKRGRSATFNFVEGTRTRNLLRDDRRKLPCSPALARDRFVGEFRALFYAKYHPNKISNP
jgi:hypothetical protein